MEKEKFKRDYFPELRSLTKKLEDSIIDKNAEEEKDITVKLEILLTKIRKANYLSR